jgi:hypothetical protein
MRCTEESFETFSEKKSLYRFGDDVRLCLAIQLDLTFSFSWAADGNLTLMSDEYGFVLVDLKEIPWGCVGLNCTISWDFGR